MQKKKPKTKQNIKNPHNHTLIAGTVTNRKGFHALAEKVSSSL